MSAYAARQGMMQRNGLLCAILEVAVANHALVRGGRAHFHVCLMSLSVLDNVTSGITAAAPLASAVQTQLREMPDSQAETTIDLATLKSSVRSFFNCSCSLYMDLS